MTLRRPWWSRYGDIATRTPAYVPAHLRAQFLDLCATFIGEHAADAEKHGWQPAHLMGPRGLGLAWLMNGDPWICPARIVWERAVMGYEVFEGELLGRRAMPDGSVGLLTGAALTGLRGRWLGRVS